MSQLLKMILLSFTCDMWPSSHHFAPSYSKLTLDQVYSPSTPVKITDVGAPATPGTSTTITNSSVSISKVHAKQ
jgi:hypothetical protein